MLWKLLLCLFFGGGILLLIAGNYFYRYAVVPSKKPFLAPQSPEAEAGEVQETKTWFYKQESRVDWELLTKDGLRLSAIYVPAKTNQHKTVLMAHGYMGNAESMGDFARMYHHLGYNVLVPDARGHGRSQGNYIGFGWHERKDYLQWIEKIIATNGPEETITLYGISMGGATVMMVAGESLPDNVVSIVEDCGYSSVVAELSYQLKEMFHLPWFPLIPVTSLITRIRAGYFFEEANAMKQLQRNERPILFIHGTKDRFVPFSMLAKVYQATSGPKEKWVVENARHAESFIQNETRYQIKIQQFLEKYPSIKRKPMK